MCGEHDASEAEEPSSLGSSPHVRGAPDLSRRTVALPRIIPACAGSTRPDRRPRGARRDHPRMCGEHSDAALMIAPRSGSSPHVRGAHGEALVRDFEVGIIPACAGSTSMSAAYLSLSRDHPRMCGEHSPSVTPPAVNTGSSPHVRGALQIGVLPVSISGIIPACAGSTGGLWGGSPCGLGSSPHVRGALRLLSTARAERGIIPACAGSTGWRGRWRFPRRDHPRMCGEHLAQNGTQGLQTGSSPHVRGALVLLSAAGELDGIIPACAGSTRSRCSTSISGRDHPRMCGEHGVGGAYAECSRGSSPHVRGALGPRRCSHTGVGIIPACAGSTKRTELSLLRSGDHPRMCGEHNIVFVPYNLYRGSSPHVRGAPVRFRGRRPRSGIIPACAGSTHMELWNKARVRDHPRMCGEHK